MRMRGEIVLKCSICITEESLDIVFNASSIHCGRLGRLVFHLLHSHESGELVKGVLLGVCQREEAKV